MKYLFILFILFSLGASRTAPFDNTGIQVDIQDTIVPNTPRNQDNVLAVVTPTLDITIVVTPGRILITGSDAVVFTSLDDFKLFMTNKLIDHPMKSRGETRLRGYMLIQNNTAKNGEITERREMYNSIRGLFNDLYSIVERFF